MLEALAPQPGGNEAIAAAAPWAALTRLIAAGAAGAGAGAWEGAGEGAGEGAEAGGGGGGGGAGGASAADVPAVALRLTHGLATDGARCRGLVEAGAVAALLPLLRDESFMSIRRTGAARRPLEHGPTSPCISPYISLHLPIPPL